MEKTNVILRRRYYIIIYLQGGNIWKKKVKTILFQ